MTKEILKRIFWAGLTNFRRNSYMTYGTTGVMVLVLLLFSGLMTLNFLSQSIVRDLQEKVDVSAYFKVDVSEDEILLVKKDLEVNDKVASVTYVSRDQALRDFREKHAGDPLIQESLAILEDNPLQASLNIKAKESGQFADIVNFLEAHRLRSLIDKIDYYENQPVITRIESISRGIGLWGAIVTIILALIATLVTFNTIRLTILNQRQEIEIMRLVGGSNWYIRAPYLVEGGLYGLFAAVLTIVIFYPVAYFISPKVAVFIPGVSLMQYFISNWWQYGLVVVVVGTLLGIISSSIAIRRFLKV